MNTISLPTNDRPHFLEQVLDSIKACPEHPNWTLVFSCEPNFDVLELVGSINWMEIKVSRNICKRHSGINTNTFNAASIAYDLGSELNLYLEDDVILSRDALTLVEQFSERDFSETSLLCLRRWHETQSNLPSVVKSDSHGLLGNGFAWRRGMWDQHLREMWFRRDPGTPAYGWDWNVSAALDRLKIPQWRPMLNRSRNIGTSGTNTAEGTDMNHFGPEFTGTPVKDFQFV